MPDFDRLVEGDPALCPARFVSPESACTEEELACKYAGGSFGIGSSMTPIDCRCVATAQGQVWSCLIVEGSDADCPAVAPWLGESDPCRPWQQCNYAASLSGAGCNCVALQNGAAGQAAGSRFECGF